jgi:hypothetical protein
MLRTHNISSTKFSTGEQLSMGIEEIKQKDTFNYNNFVVALKYIRK